ncbi:uncharacterized protein LAESUDRAFT_353426 [Laetiporus sulphureus 93-53]|uniref:Uncharacterized protein n=1 Tax=Laetiporus sulphureus 93-53 TaxID=1314785 RepID=A0A165GVF2_9APHY|nr:uncharacterized protein LAESUDRAFT_353426 [Laetiporus sulphureus 93-53]KZT10873.1 hypothetical protein LAESUDRAFT_353426 [Laetiporus sulphureus 93-53]
MSPLPTNDTFHVGLPFLHGRSAIDIPMIPTAALAAGVFWFDVTPVRTVVYPVIRTTARSARLRRLMLRSVGTIARRMFLLPTNDTSPAMCLRNGCNAIDLPMIHATAQGAGTFWFDVSLVRTVNHPVIRTTAGRTRPRRFMPCSLGSFIFGHDNVGHRIDRGLSSRTVLRNSRTSVCVWGCRR